MMRVEVRPKLLSWARERAGLSLDSLRKRFPRLESWERGEAKPTFKQLEVFAKTVFAPIGYLFLAEPPEERIPIPDLRTIAGKPLAAPSPDLLDTIYAMQLRQAWLREERLESENEPLNFVGSATLADTPEDIGREMRRAAGFGDGWAAKISTWKEAVSLLRRAIEAMGVVAVINGIVGNNTHRRLDVEEFRGFALSDHHAPLIFVNGADAKSAQMFSLVHELGHIWLGESALTDVGLASSPSQRIEAWCDRAAAEFLVPARELRTNWQDVRHDPAPFEAIARRFKVSPIVAGRRAMDLRLVDRETFSAFYEEYIGTERRRRPAAGGGDFYNIQNARVGRLFATQVMRAAKEGRLSFKQAYDLTGLHGGVFQEYARHLGIDLP